MYNKLTTCFVLSLCFAQLHADTAPCALSRVQETHVQQAEQKFASMRRNSALRSWIAFSLQLGFTAAELYMIFAPAKHQGTTSAPEKLGWGASIKHFFSDLGTLTLKSILLTIIHQQAAPVMAKMRERVPMTTDNSWFLRHYQAQSVEVSHELHAFIQLLQSLDGAVISLSQLKTNDGERIVAVGNYIVSLVEQLLGHMRCMGKLMECTDSVGALLAGRVIMQITQATNSFCEQIEAVCETTKGDLAEICTTFAKTYQNDLLLLSSVSAYRVE